MANRHATLTSLFTDVANAIRGKTGSTDVIKADDFDTEIANIPTGGPSATPKDINFYDYDGTLLHSWTLEELESKTELPELPTQEGLTCQGWNWSLADLKTQNTKMNVGATYITDDGKTRVYIHLEDGRTELKVGIGLDGTCIVDFGDGHSETIIGGNVYSIVYTNLHNYSTAGDYVITLDVTGSALFLGSSSNSYLIVGPIAAVKAYGNSIRKIEIGNNISIGNYAFFNYYSLSNIIIPNSVTDIGSSAFSSCSSLLTIVIPKSVNAIKGSIFFNCYSLSTIVIPNNVDDIASSAFYYCRSLSTIVIPNSVTSIKSHAFEGCYSLPNVVISNMVTSIGSETFISCYSLVNITIPNTLTRIETLMFNSCSSIKYVDFSTFTSIPTLSGTSAFGGLPSDYEIRVPLALLDDWKAATNWSSLASHIVGV